MPTTRKRAPLRVAANPATPKPDPAAALVREVRKSNSWIDSAKSFRVHIADTWTTPANGNTPVKVSHGTVDLGFDQKRLFSRIGSPQDPITLTQREWDGKKGMAIVQYAVPQEVEIIDGKSVQGTELYAPLYKADSDNFPFFITWVPWATFGPHNYWWLPKWERMNYGLSGKPSDFHTEPDEAVHGVQCHVVDCDVDYWHRLYIGIADHRLYGVTEYAVPGSIRPKIWVMDIKIAREFGSTLSNIDKLDAWEASLSPSVRQRFKLEKSKRTRQFAQQFYSTWFSDYQQIAPGDWFPMHQEQDSYDSDSPGDKQIYQTICQVKLAKVNQPLPAKWFDQKLKEGVPVSDWHHKPHLSYFYKKHFTPKLWQAILDAGKKREADTTRRTNAMNFAMNLAVGKPVPLFSGTWVQGGPFTLASLRGKVTIAAFWATWCGRCQNDVPALNQLFADAKHTGVGVISIHAAGTPIKGVLKAIADEKIKYPVYLDGPAKSPWAGDEFKAAHVLELPIAMVIGPDGNVAGVGSLAKMQEIAGRLVAAVPDGKRARGR